MEREKECGWVLMRMGYARKETHSHPLPPARTQTHTHTPFPPQLPSQTQTPSQCAYKSRLPMPRSLILPKEETSVVGIESNGKGSSASAIDDGPACLGWAKRRRTARNKHDLSLLFLPRAATLANTPCGVPRVVVEDDAREAPRARGAEADARSLACLF